MNALLAAAVAITTVGVGSNALERWSRRTRTPRLAMAAWFGMIIGLFTAVVVALGLIVSGSLELWMRSMSGLPMAELLAHCHHAVSTTLPGTFTFHTEALAAVAAIVGVVALVRLTVVGMHSTISLRRERRRHDRWAQLAAASSSRTTSSGHRQLTLTVPTLAAYSIPGRRTIIMTSAAVSQLNADEQRAVLAHESAHLGGRHHLLVDGLRVARQAFPFVASLRRADLAVRRLVELRADDVAAAQAGRAAVVSALAKLQPVAAQGVLAMRGGDDLTLRVDRLVGGQKLPKGQAALLLTLGCLLAVSPVVGAVALHALTC